MQNNNLFTPASEAQINAIKKLGYTGDVEGLTVSEASDIIKDLQAKRYNTAPANESQKATTNYNNYSSQTTSTNVAKVGNNDVQAAREIGVADTLLANLTELASDGSLYIPENYSVGNALKSAMSKILTSEQANALLACTPESKTQALTEYIVQGLDASKTQAYFIPYGNKMVMMRSYFGDVAVVKRTGLVEDVYAIVIYEGDEIEIGFDEYGRKTLISHKTSFSNQDNEIIGAYAVIVGKNGYKAYEFMTRKELEKSWEMSKLQKGKLLTNYKQEAAKRTVIRRAVKMIFNTSLNTTEEQTQLIGSYNRTTPDEYDNEKVINAEIKDSNLNEVKHTQSAKTASKKITPEEVNNDIPDGWDSQA